MNLYILRHASAGTSKPNPALDAKRPLDKEGKEHCLHLAHTLNALKTTFDLIISSPLKRALQTAQLIATETGYEAEITQSPALEPKATLTDFRQLLEQVLREQTPVYENVLLVGHNPNLSTFLGSLFVDRNQPEGCEVLPARVRLRKGSLARVALARGEGTLLSVLDPRTIARFTERRPRGRVRGPRENKRPLS